jgi:hypothetical protein
LSALVEFFTAAKLATSSSYYKNITQIDVPRKTATTEAHAHSRTAAIVNLIPEPPILISVDYMEAPICFASSKLTRFPLFYLANCVNSPIYGMGVSFNYWLSYKAVSGTKEKVKNW